MFPGTYARKQFWFRWIYILSVTAVFTSCGFVKETMEDLGNTLPGIGDPTTQDLVVKDPATGSENYTNQTTVTIELPSLGGVVGWCLSESQSSVPASGAACSGSAGPDSGWYSSAPSSVALSAGDGVKTLYLWLKDSSGVVRSDPLTATILVDATVPTVSISAQPVAITNSNAATFQFSGNDGIGSGIQNYQCKIDAGSYASCTSPKSYTGLSEGNHTFYVQSVDRASNVSVVASYTWQVDTAAPTVNITSGPSNPTNVNTAAIQFTGDPGGGSALSGYLCKLDAAAYASCTSPVNLSGLSDGSHTFYVKVTDAAGNESTPVSHTWVVDTQVPTVTITSTPSHPSSSSTANFAFSASNLGTGLALAECRIDAGSFGSCSSPKNYTGLGDGSHTFSVRVTTNAGNVSNIVSHTWTIDTSVPTISYGISPASPATESTQTVSGTCSDTGSGVPASGIKICIKAGVCGAYPSADFAISTNCVNGNYSYDATISDGTYDIEVVAVDSAGNVSSTLGQGGQNYIVDTAAPAAFSILGATGGADVTADEWLTANTDLVVSWSDTTGETSYDVTIRNAADSADVCPTVNKAADSTTHTFTGCSLTQGTIYKLKVVAKDNAGNQTEATESPYSFIQDYTAPVLGTFTAPTADGFTASTNYLFSWNMATDTGGGLHASETFFVETFDNGTCSGAAVSSGWQPAASINLINLAVGTTYSVRITAKDAAGLVSNSACSSGIERTASAFTWVGTGGNNLWTNGANWSGTNPPGVNDVAVFDSTCVPNCDVLIDDDISIGGISIATSYSGIITQDPGETITVGSGNWSQAGGSFVGADALIDINGVLTLAGGSFTSTSGALQLGASGAALSSHTFLSISNGAAFIHNGGEVEVVPTRTAGCVNETYSIDVDTSLTLNNLTVDIAPSSCPSNHYFKIASGDYLVIAGELNHARGLIYGDFRLTGNLVVQSTAPGSPGIRPVFGGITFTGAANQTYARTSPGRTARLIIDKTGGSVAPAGGTTSMNSAGFVILNGSFTAPTGTFTIGGSDGGASNSTTIFQVSPTGIFTPNNGTIAFAPSRSSGCGSETYTIDVNTALSLHNVTVNVPASSCPSEHTLRMASGDSLTVNNLTLTSGKLNGSYQVAGNLNVAATFAGGAAALTLTGTSAQTVTQSGTMPSGTFKVDKSSNTATLTTALTLNSAGQDLVLASGTLDLATFNLTVNDRITHTGGNINLVGSQTIVAGTYNPSNTAFVQYTGTGTYTGLAFGDFYGGLRFTNTGSYTLDNALTAYRIVLGSSTLSTAGNQINLGGIWEGGAGTFNHDNGTVVLTGSGNHEISGSNTFYNLTRSISSASTLSFESGSTTTVVGTLTLQGTSGQLLSLRSLTDGSVWTINPQGARSIQYLDVKDSTNANATSLDSGGNSVDSGNNTNWNF